MNLPRALIVGDTAFDHYLYVDPTAGADEKEAVEVALRTLGGTGANAANVAARIGAEVTFLTAVGDDQIGSWLRQELEKSAIKDVRAQIFSGESMVATILNERGMRRVFVAPGGARPLRVAADLELDDYDVVYVTFAPECALEVLTRAPASQVIVGAEHWMFRDAAFSEGVLAADVVVTNEAGWAIWDPRTTPGHVVVTRGSQGATLYRPNAAAMHFPAPEVTAIDATGAGDSFAGVLVALLAKGRSIEAAVRRAVIAGALATTQRGNQSSFGSEADLDPELWQSSAR